MLKKFSLKALQKAINHALSLDPALIDKMAPLSGKWIELIVEPLGVNFFIGFKPDGILLQDELVQPAHTIIRSSPLGFIRLSFLPASKARSLFNDHITMSGDVETGQQVKHLFDALDIDWEGHLAQFTGDIVAHQLGTVFRQGRDFGQRVVSSFHHNVDEYIHEELQLAPGAEELADFYQDIDDLLMDVERVEAQFKCLAGAYERD
ncbi:MAG: SCP2 sterol-binding domain-containing protein [Legionellaceae bacterium]|nr:SCP2 sterol-binding domain-containing protein [Legionellaceae bacterium]